MAKRRAASAVLAGLMLVIISAGNALAMAPEILTRNAPIAFEGVDTEICPGIEVLVTFEGKRSVTGYYTADGEESRLVFHVQYWATFTNVADPSLTVSGPGTRNIEFDLINDTYTDTGAYRSITDQGSGSILLQTGRWLANYDETVVYAINGPHEEWLGETEEFCAALGG
jgi:hypothetical protein